MNIFFRFIHIILTIIITIYTSSCVQGYLYDEMYDECGDFSIQRNKKSKDAMSFYSPTDITAGQFWLENHPWSENESECMAHALCSWSGLSKGVVRTGIAVRVFSNDIQYAALYKYYVTIQRGLPTTINMEEEIINAVVGASSLWLKGDNEEDLLGILSNNIGGIVGAEMQNIGSHFAILENINPGGKSIKVSDQTQYGTVFFIGEIDSVYN